MDLGGGKDEFHVSRGLLEGLEEGIEGLPSEHVDFVDDVDFEFSAGGGIRDAVPQVFDFADAAVRGAVDFEDVQTTAFLDFLTDILVGIEVGLGTARAVEGLGEDAGGGGFADAAGPDEEESVGEATFGKGVGKGAHDVLLADEFRKGAGPVFAGENEVTHGKFRIRSEAGRARNGRGGRWIN